MQQVTEFLAQVKGVPVVLGLALVILSLLGHIFPALSFLAWNDLLLHLGMIIGLGGLLFTDTL
ncbi:MAG: hypothetical protein Kow0063_32980 [Anaerolineae bacterium]